MNTIRLLPFALLALALSACNRSAETPVADAEQAVEEAPPAASEPEPAADDAAPTTEEGLPVTEITPGLTMRMLKEGSGDAAAAGQMATVHYTGWLHDPSAPDKRGAKFDSSVDRGEPFQFPLGAGRVIQGWDRGVEGMLIGESRELTIAPELAYGDRAIGELIPPGSTLLFEVELLGLDGAAAD